MVVGEVGVVVMEVVVVEVLEVEVLEVVKVIRLSLKPR